MYRTLQLDTRRRPTPTAAASSGSFADNQRRPRQSAKTEAWSIRARRGRRSLLRGYFVSRGAPAPLHRGGAAALAVGAAAAIRWRGGGSPLGGCGPPPPRAQPARRTRHDVDAVTGSLLRRPAPSSPSNDPPFPAPPLPFALFFFFFFCHHAPGLAHPRGRGGRRSAGGGRPRRCPRVDHHLPRHAVPRQPHYRGRPRGGRPRGRGGARHGGAAGGGPHRRR